MISFKKILIVFSQIQLIKLIMKKFIYLFLLSVSFQYNADAQPASTDKNKVMDFFQNQQFEEAVNYLIPAATIDSQNIQLLGYLGYAHYMNDNTKMAADYFRKIIAINPDNISALQYLAILTKNDKPDQALQYTRRLIYLQPDKAAHLRSMGELFKRKDKQDSAFVYYNQAYILQPKDYKNGVGLADILIDNKKFIRADSIIESVLEQDSVNIPFLKLRVRSAYIAGDYQNVRIPGERLIRLQETSLSALTQVVVAYFNLKLYTDCIRVCEYLIAQGYAVENIFFFEAKALARIKQFDKSNELLKTCINLSISKEAEMYYYNLGINYEALRQYKKAIAQYDTANYLFKNPIMNFNSGRIYEINLKNMQQAQKYYTKYLALAKPVEADEKKAYQYLKERWGKKKPVAPKK